MKNYPKYLLAGALICVAGSIAISALAMLVILLTLRGAGPGEPFAYYEWLRLPILSIALPVVGMLFLTGSWQIFLGRRKVNLNVHDLLVKPPLSVEAADYPLPKAA
ncbi:MAG: hypothetical protein AB7U82_14455 [Blastocatellales bacterium]